MMFSIVTPTFNSEKTIRKCIISLYSQTFKCIEHIVVDGGSTDNTCQIINSIPHSNRIFLSEPDNGIYDAINKGLALATGDVVGILHSDDFYNGENVLELISEAFRYDVDILYANINYVNKDGKLLRRWDSKNFSKKSVKFGRMPPHPTLFLKYKTLKEVGFYDAKFKISGDFDYVQRLFARDYLNSVYIDKVIINMLVGGVSTKGFRNHVRKVYEDFLIMNKNHGLLFALLFTPLKSISKIHQFFIRFKSQ